MDITISKINEEHLNPFGATKEELVANALSEAGLATCGTIINGTEISALCSKYYEKRQIFKNSTKMGNILIQHKTITPDELHKALLYQKKHPGKKLGDALVALGVCNVSDVDVFLQTQTKVRNDINNKLINSINSLVC